MQISKSLSALALAALFASLPAVHAADNAAQAAARQALAQKLFELSASAPAAQAPVAAQATCTPTATCCQPVLAGPAGDNPAQAAARQALVKALFESGTPAPAAAPAVAKPEGKVAVKKAVAPVAAPVNVEAPKTKAAANDLPPILAPASPIPATKEAKLEALLNQYKADQISPAEYHQQRAAILAQP